MPPTSAAQSTGLDLAPEPRRSSSTVSPATNESTWRAREGGAAFDRRQHMSDPLADGLIGTDTIGLSSVSRCKDSRSALGLPTALRAGRPTSWVSPNSSATGVPCVPATYHLQLLQRDVAHPSRGRSRARPLSPRATIATWWSVTSMSEWKASFAARPAGVAQGIGRFAVVVGHRLKIDPALVEDAPAAEAGDLPPPDRRRCGRRYRSHGRPCRADRSRPIPDCAASIRAR